MKKRYLIGPGVAHTNQGISPFLALSATAGVCKEFRQHKDDHLSPSLLNISSDKKAGERKLYRLLLMMTCLERR